MERTRFVYRFAALLLCLLGGFGVAKSAVTLVISHPGGTSTRFALYTCPKVLFTADSVFVVSPVASFRFAASSVLKCTYDKSTTGVSSATPSEKYRMAGDLLLFDPSVKASSVRLFTSGGTAVSVELQETGDGLSLSLSSLAPGVYLCKAGSQTIKITRP